jgi:hypothetical protein
MMEAFVKKEDPGAAVHPSYANLDIQHVGDPVWLVRLPDFLFSEFRTKTSRVQIGTIQIDSTEDPTHPNVTISFNHNAVSQLPFEALPQRFDVRVEHETQAQQYFFSHRRDCGYVRVLGHVIGEGRVTSPDLQCLLQCRCLLEKVMRPKKPSKVHTMLDQIPQTASPFLASPGWRLQRKKPAKDRRLKMTTNEVKMELLMAFQEKPEWAIRDLAERLDQGTDHIAKFIGEIADYDQRTRVYRIRPASQLCDEDVT